MACGYLESIIEDCGINMYTRALMYSKPDCPYCLKAERALIKAEIEFEKKIIGIDISVEDFKELLPDAKSVPQIYLYDNSGIPHYIGGYVNLLQEIYNNNEDI